MHGPRIRPVAVDEDSRAVSVQLAAFIADPITRWLWPDPHEYLAGFPRIVRGFGGGAFDNGGADVSEGFMGCALWLAPGVYPDEEALGQALSDSVPEPRRSEMLSVLEQMGESHPEETHWHLAIIGVDVAHQGKGVGAALMQERLTKLDAQGVHSYLESTNLRNIPFYERHGFQVIREIQVGSSPPMIPMLRPPR